MKRRMLISLILCLCLIVSAALAGCGDKTEKKDEATEAAKAVTATPDEIATEADAKTDGIDYMVLVNKTHALPEDWEEKLETVHTTNTVGSDVEVEKKAYDAYLKLKAELEKEGVFVDLDSARRSVADQQRIMDEFTADKGADYAAKTVAQPGYSEHHTGLALDLYLIIDGKDVDENDDMIQYPEIWEKIHAKLADYGFILRYLEGREHITGYGYEPWHIRYLDDVDTAKEIMSKDITFEEYLGTASGAPVEIDLGFSQRYSVEELESAVVTIKCKFASWDGCELHSIRYAGDDAVTEDKLEWLNTLNPNGNYTQGAEFLMDFHTPKDTGDTTFNPDDEYVDYQWWLGYSEKDGWDIASFGY